MGPIAARVMSRVDPDYAQAVDFLRSVPIGRDALRVDVSDAVGRFLEDWVDPSCRLREQSRFVDPQQVEALYRALVWHFVEGR